MTTVKGWLRRLVVAGAFVCACSNPLQTAAPSITTCPAANPFDALPDDGALQACLDNNDWVLLQPDSGPGYVGYLVENTIKIKRPGTLLTTADNPRKATIKAARGLVSSMLRGLGVDNFEISFIRFDGNRANRIVGDKPCDVDFRNYRNVELMGSGFRVRYVDSFNAVCGSAMTIGNSDSFEVSRSLFYDNGSQPEDANGVQAVWADGLTVFKCENGTIRDNEFWDNTDVDLGVNGGRGCSVYRNRIRHEKRYAFAGLVAGDPSRSGGEFSDNSVTSAENMLGFGIVVGCHVWPGCVGQYASGVEVYNNGASGAVVNLLVDGLDGGMIRNNSLSRARGSRILNCPGISADYVVGHIRGDTRLQSGYIVRDFDFGSSCR